MTKRKHLRPLNRKRRNSFITASNCRTACLGWGGRPQFDLLCFIYHRYQRAHDNLIETLIYNVRRFVDEAKFTAKERIYEYYIENNQNMRKAGQVLKIFTDDSIATEPLPIS